MLRRPPLFCNDNIFCLNSFRFAEECVLEKIKKKFQKSLDFQYESGIIPSWQQNNKRNLENQWWDYRVGVSRMPVPNFGSGANRTQYELKVRT